MFAPYPIGTVAPRLGEIESALPTIPGFRVSCKEKNPEKTDLQMVFSSVPGAIFRADKCCSKLAFKQRRHVCGRQGDSACMHARCVEERAGDGWRNDGIRCL